MEPGVRLNAEIDAVPAKGARVGTVCVAGRGGYPGLELRFGRTLLRMGGQPAVDL